MDWPKTLPIPLASGYSVDDAFEVIRPAGTLGFSPEVRRGQINKPKTVNTSLTLTFDQFAVFDWLVTRKLRNGAIWINTPVKFDNSVFSGLSRFISVSASVEGLFWKVTAKLEVMPDAPEEQLETVIFYHEQLSLPANTSKVFQVKNMIDYCNHGFQINDSAVVSISATIILDTPVVPIGSYYGPTIFQIDGQFQFFEIISDSDIWVSIMGNNVCNGF